MEICVILPCNIYTAPYYKRYENLILESCSKFDLILWNRANIIEETKANVIPFNAKDKVNNRNITKVFNFVRFANFVKRKLKQKRYDKVIILGSYAGIMAQLSSFLEKYYKNKYWLDIRDFTYENIPLYYRAMGKAIRNSYSTAISSPGYKKFLPQYNYVIAHNLDKINIKKSLEVRRNYVSSFPIRISFIGLIRYLDENKKLLNILGNDKRFILQYYGMNVELIQNYCIENNIVNVDFHGRFDPSDTALFYKKTDIINNLYGNNKLAVTTALSNKLYFSSGLQIPILVCPNTYMESVTVNGGFGFSFDYTDPKIGDKLFEWYTNLQKNDNNASYNEFFEEVLKEDNDFEIKFIEFITTTKIP